MFWRQTDPIASKLDSTQPQRCDTMSGTEIYLHQPGTFSNYSPIAKRFLRIFIKLKQIMVLHIMCVRHTYKRIILLWKQLLLSLISAYWIDWLRVVRFRRQSYFLKKALTVNLEWKRYFFSYFQNKNALPNSQQPAIWRIIKIIQEMLV